MDIEVVWTSEDEARKAIQPGEPHVILKAYESPQEPGKMLGMVEGGRQSGPRTARIHAPPFGMTIVDAYQNAVAYAAEQGISRVFAIDPDGRGRAALEEAGV